MSAEVDPQFHWGSSVVNLHSWDLPAMKAKFLVDHAPATGRVVEIGSGGGKMLRTLAQQRPGLTLFGCDMREPGEPPAEYTFTKVEPDAGLPYDDASFDLLAIMDVLEHVPNPAQMLGEAARVLRRGGQLVAFVPCEGEPFGTHKLFRRLWGDDLYVQTKEHIQAFTHRELDALVDAHFDVHERRYLYHTVGQTMDATMFALTSFEPLKTLFWSKNQYYNTAPTAPSLLSRVFNGALTLGNAIAFAESTLLTKLKATAGGQLFAATRR